MLNSGPVSPGQSKTWSTVGAIPGFFFYHCSADALNGIWEHVASGMYGGIVVHPTNEEKAKEFYVAFGEIYGSNIPLHYLVRIKLVLQTLTLAPSWQTIMTL